jgi:predicted GNAT superfamily acetyltransferase
MDIYDRWLKIKQKHRTEKHEGEGLRKDLRDVQEDLSCKICYVENQVSEEFKEFWKIINKIIEGLEADGYNWITIKGFNDRIFVNETDEEQKNKILRRIV